MKFNEMYFAVVRQYPWFGVLTITVVVVAAVLSLFIVFSERFREMFMNLLFEEESDDEWVARRIKQLRKAAHEVEKLEQLEYEFRKRRSEIAAELIEETQYLERFVETMSEDSDDKSEVME